MSETKFPQTLQDAIKFFADDARAFEYMKAVRWPTGTVTCPRCDSDKNSFVSTRKIWHCTDCKRQFSIRVGTIFEDSPIKFDKWICATWLIANAKNGISSYEIGRSIGVCQKTAWFMLQRIRLAMQNGTVVKIGGTVEVDEPFIGGRSRFKHAHRKAKGGGWVGMTPVQGLLERTSRKGPSKVILKVLKTVRKKQAQEAVREYVLKGSEISRTHSAPTRASTTTTRTK
jgi:transposase-like protein